MEDNISHLSLIKRSCLFLCFINVFKKFKFIFILNYFFVFSYCFDMLISKIIFKKYKKIIFMHF
jgi:hypothetical protein